jgi:pimeloyl-ACP methyl ester carboxylesterase
MRQDGRARWIGLALLAAVAAGGCRGGGKYLSVREVPDSPLVERLHLTGWSGPQASPRTRQVLRRYGLEGDLDGDDARLLARLQQQITHDPQPEAIYAYAEAAYLAGKRQQGSDAARALDLFADSVTHSYRYLFDRRTAAEVNPFDPQFRAACDLYNGALEDCLRIASEQGLLTPGFSRQIRSGNEFCDVLVVARGAGWHAGNFERFEFASDFEMAGLRNKYRTYGLGVPLIAVRKRQPNDPLDRYYPPELAFPVTAFLRLSPAAQGQPRQALLELYDPLTAAQADLAGLPVPLESDLTTPLAYFLESGSLPALATMGLLRPDESQKLRGLYLAQPYEEGKIPVLFVHGLWSDPTTWAEMFNDLRAAPEIRRHYQFWFYFYPSGQPFWYSAAQLRKDLAEMRQTLDPLRENASLDQMVLVGHSMGGLVSKLQAVDSGDEFWRTVSDQPIDQIKASPEVRQALERTFYFRANPSIRRVITIGTPHRGSEFANPATRYVGSKLIELPKLLMQGQEELFRDNPEAFGPHSTARVGTSIDSLAPDSPLLPALLAARPTYRTQQHNIVGVKDLEDGQPVPPDGTDGIVSYASAHLDDIASERAVPADHLSVHRNPLSVLEVRRVLLEHLAVAQRESPGLMVERPNLPPKRGAAR